jgi:tetratricopeptide (TPR) repeat protein
MESAAPARARTPARAPVAALASLVALVFVVACSPEAPEGDPAAPAAPAAPAEPAAPAYTGGAVCARCHPEAFQAWRGSHHDLAMQEATADTVLGDFDDATFTHRGVTATFSHRDGRFAVRTQGPDGVLADFDVAFTFGVDPLQQYLIRFPDGRVQALGVAWDTRPVADGGRRWYALYPDEDLVPGDPLHWTGIQQNWNHMCAECHSTGLRKGYSADADRFDTTWSEIDVACEACHGPGSRHVAWADAVAKGEEADPADARLPVDLGSDARWVFDPDAPIARLDGPRPGGFEVQVCGRCHSRRGLLRERDAADGPLLDTHRLALLEDGLYQLDGQILDEVYVMGSFLQSRMHAAGVRCRDCHDPHSGRAVREGGADAVCAGCHRPEVFAAPSHHRHPPGSEGASCGACHMPSRTYMGVDVRHDHGFRVPRPDLSARLGTSNACTDCHVDRDAAWASSALAAWSLDGRAGTPHFATALGDARAHRPGAGAALAGVAGDPDQPAIVRATALRELGITGGAGREETVARGLDDADPLVRLGALGAAIALEPPAQLRLAAPLLADPVLAVRLEAEATLRDLPAPLWSPADRSRLAEVQGEFRAVQMLNADRPESWVNLGNLAVAQGDLPRARSDYERALAIESDFVPALVNLADLERRGGRDDRAETHLERAAQAAPDNADVQYALGLTWIRQGRREEAVRALGRAMLLAPDRPRYALVYALALDGVGRRGEAVVALEGSLERFPGDVDVLLALTNWARERGDFERAADHARRLVEATGGDPRARELLATIEAAARRATP